MNRVLIVIITAVALLALLFGPQPSVAHAKQTFITIGTGGMTGVYYPTGGAIARMVNKKKKVYNIRCTYESTGGSVFNINAVMNGDLEFGIAQSDRQYQAFYGMPDSEWSGNPQKDLRSVFSIHPESVTLVAAVDAHINCIQDLKGKRVNIGNPGSGHRQNAIDALSAAGLDYQTDLVAESVKAAEAPKLLQDGRIDAFFYTVGHPSGAIKEATAGQRNVRFVPITGIETLLKERPYYTSSYVPVHLYPAVQNKSDVETFGVRATLITSIHVPEQVVYAVTKEVFEHFSEFKKLHPAYQVLTHEKMLEGLSAPLHPGAARYYKEAALQ